MCARLGRHTSTATTDDYPDRMDRPAPDPRKLLDQWDEWERGETPPGRVMSNLKTGGLRDLLDGLARSQTT